MVTHAATLEEGAPESSDATSGQGGRDAGLESLLHASAVRFGGKGVLLLGASNSGKSDLALRLIDAGGVLIADDQVRLTRRGNRLEAEPPERLAGLIALRGIGIMRVPFAKGLLDLAVDLVATGMADHPLPEPAFASWLGVDLPKIALEPVAPSAVARIKMILDGERAF